MAKIKSFKSKWVKWVKWNSKIEQDKNFTYNEIINALKFTKASLCLKKKQELRLTLSVLNDKNIVNIFFSLIIKKKWITSLKSWVFCSKLIYCYVHCLS